MPIYVNFLATKPNLSWGVNLSASYVPFLADYDIRFSNNYYENNSHSSKAVNGGSTLIIPIVFFGPGTYGFSHLKVGYDILGFELGTSTYLKKKFMIRPFLGLLASWMWNRQKSSFTIQDTSFLYVKSKQNFFGIGPQAGLNCNFSLNKSLSIFLDSKGALFYGSFRNLLVASESMFLPDFFNFETFKVSDKKVTPYLSFTLGGSYDFFDKTEKNHFKLRAGYQVQYFASANQNILNQLFGEVFSISERARDDISTQGLILDLAWSF